MNKLGEIATRLLLNGSIAVAGCALPETQFQQTNQLRPTRNAGQGYFGDFERAIPPDDGKEYSAGETPRGWRIYERRSDLPEGHVDEKRKVYIEEGRLCIVGVSSLWNIYGSEQSAIRDAQDNAAEVYGRLVHDTDDDGNFQGMTSGLWTEANELVIVKNPEGETALVAEVRCSIPLNRVPTGARPKIMEKYGR